MQSQTVTRVQLDFVPGSIHKEEFREFWRTNLEAGEWVMDVLRDGYVIPFVRIPPTYEEANNKSAIQEMGFVQQAVAELRRQGVIQFTDEKPHCVSPLTVAKKMNDDGVLKNRLCLDLSRCVNLCVKEQRVALSHLQRALEMTRELDFQVKYDLKQAYHHIRIHPSQTTFLGASIPKEDGGTQYFVFLHLPFGLSSAVHCLTKLFKPVNAFIHKMGIRHSIYLDDGRIVAETMEEAEEQRPLVYDVLDRSGWILEVKKSDGPGDSSQCKVYLGFIIDTAQMTVRLEELKKQRILKQVRDALLHGSGPISAKDLARTLGKIVAAEPALGPVVIMIARAAYADLEKATRERGWGTLLTMSQEAINGLQFFLDNCSRFDNAPIRSAATEISVLSIIGPPSAFMKTGFVANHVRTGNENIWASDASGYATCAYSIQGDHLYFRGTLNEEERGYSSGHRELLAVTKTLDYYQQSAAISNRATNIYWLTDSENLVTFLTKGSGKSDIQKEVFRMMILCQNLNVKIIPIHLLREDPRIKVADDGSKTIDTDDWRVDVETFRRNHERLNFTIDLFASNRNSQCTRFYSNFYCPNTSGVDAFSHSWDGETAWICPPVKEVLKIIKKIRQSKMTGMLFVPEWRTAAYWVEIFGVHGTMRWPFKRAVPCRPFLIQEDFDHRSPFSGRPHFNFLQIWFDSH